MNGETPSSESEKPSRTCGLRALLPSLARDESVAGHRSFGHLLTHRAMRHPNAAKREAAVSQLVKDARAAGEKVPESVANIRFRDELSPREIEIAKSLRHKVREIHARKKTVTA